MENIVDFECVDTMLMAPLYPSVSHAVTQAGMDRHEAPAALLFAKKYFIKCTFGTFFYANDVTFERAKSDAILRCERNFFQPVMRELEQIRAIAYKYSDSEMLMAIDKAFLACKVS